MKATIEVPNDLYRRLKAKSALEGRAIREVALELFTGYVSGERITEVRRPESVAQPDIEPLPVWFGALRKYARRTSRHDMEAIRESIAAGVAREWEP